MLACNKRNCSAELDYSVLSLMYLLFEFSVYCLYIQKYMYTGMSGEKVKNKGLIFFINSNPPLLNLSAR